MVRLFAFVRRREGLSVEEFRHHWHEVHGPLLRDTPALASLILRYEQHVRLSDSPYSGSPDVDGVAVQWFRELSDFEAFVAAPEYASLIAPDEARFLDPSTLRFLVTDDEPVVVIDGPTSAAGV